MMVAYTHITVGSVLQTLCLSAFTCKISEENKVSITEPTVTIFTPCEMCGECHF